MEADVERVLRDLDALLIEVDQETHQHASKVIMALAAKYKLSSYDAVSCWPATTPAPGDPGQKTKGRLQGRRD